MELKLEEGKNYRIRTLLLGETTTAEYVGEDAVRDYYLFRDLGKMIVGFYKPGCGIENEVIVQRPSHFHFRRPSHFGWRGEK